MSADITAEDAHRHLHKMEGHIQRAALDICKFLCIYYDEFYKREIHAQSDVMALVSNGTFLIEANELATSAEATLLRAKEADSNLGETVDVNREVVELYCEAVFSYKRIETLYRENNENITQARLNSKRMRTTSLVTQLMIAAGVAILFFLLGMFFD